MRYVKPENANFVLMAIYECGKEKIVSTHKTMKALVNAYKKLSEFRKLGTFGETFWYVDFEKMVKTKILGVA